MIADPLLFTASAGRVVTIGPHSDTVLNPQARRDHYEDLARARARRRDRNGHRLALQLAAELDAALTKAAEQRAQQLHEGSAG